jgi:hypothetical protein
MTSLTATLPIKALCVLLGCACAGPVVAEEKSDKTAPREYSAGPLTKDDFQAKVPEAAHSAGGAALRAFISGGVYHRYRYRYTTASGQVRLMPTEIRVFAAVDREKSWNATPGDAELLDHEQGHFDLAAVYAAKLQAELLGLMTRGDLTFTAKTEAAGRQALDDRLKKLLNSTLDELRAEDQRYDRETRHGNDRTEQAKHRAHHRRLLSELKKTPAEGRKKP